MTTRFDYRQLSRERGEDSGWQRFYTSNVPPERELFLAAGVPAGFDAVYAFDVIEHFDDPFGFLAALEAQASIVMINLLEPIRGDTPLHRELPIPAILRHAARRGLCATAARRDSGVARCRW